MTELSELTPAERAAADAAVARLRAEQTNEAQFEQFDPPPVRENPTEMRDRLEREQAEKEAEDFGAFWDAQGRTGKRLRNVVPGVDVQLPASLPLVFEIEVKRLADDRSLAAVHKVFGRLYGPDTLAKLIDGGLNGDQLSVLIVWGSANAAGKDMDLQQATAEFERMKAADQGNGDRRAGSGKSSSGTGPSSKPTSRGSTRKKGRKKR